MNDESSEQARHADLVRDAFARGETALTAGDKAEAMRWLDRAHRLAPNDGTIALVLASAMIGAENARAAVLFAEVLASHDVRDAWFGLATARFLIGDLAGARAALGKLLSLHALRSDTANLANQVASAVGAAGWCGLSSDGVLVVHSIGSGRISTNNDGRPVNGGILSPGWPRRTEVSVMVGRRHPIGSPISLQSIGRVEGDVELSEGGLRGWAWCPGDPETNPRLSVRVGRSRIEIVATEPAGSIPGLAPLARPRSFEISRSELPAGVRILRVRGRDGRELSGSPVTIDRQDAGGISLPPTRHPPARPGNLDQHGAAIGPPARPADDGKRRRWRGKTAEAVILVTHDDGGGVERRVRASAAWHEARGRWPIVLRPTKGPDGAIGVAVDGGKVPTLRFELPREQPALFRLLRDIRPARAELHHFLNHDPSVLQTVRALGIPYDVQTHDFAWFCPRIALVGRGDRYCGEPAPSVCEQCVAKMGSYLHEDISVAALLDRSRQILSEARRVTAPSHDAATRMERHFPDLALTVVPHEDDDVLEELPPIPLVTGTVRVVVAGAIGLHKGFHVLLACARDARKRRLDLTFIVAGTTIDDQRLIDTGRVFVTGPYQPDEAVTLIRAQDATLALLPSIWPETWCLGLTELWRAGLRVAAFDIGAPAERISRTGRGFLLPLGLSPPAINDALLNAAKGRSLLPIRSTSAYKPSR